MSATPCRRSSSSNNRSDRYNRLDRGSGVIGTIEHIFFQLDTNHSLHGGVVYIRVWFRHKGVVLPGVVIMATILLTEQFQQWLPKSTRQKVRVQRGYIGEGIVPCVGRGQPLPPTRHQPVEQGTQQLLGMVFGGHGMGISGGRVVMGGAHEGEGD